MEQYIELTSQPNKNNLLFLILQIVTFLFCVLHIQILLKTSPTFRMCIKISIQFKHILFAYKLQMGLDTSYDNISEILSLKSQYTSLIKEKHIMTQYFIFFKIEWVFFFFLTTCYGMNVISSVLESRHIYNLSLSHVIF